MIKKQYTILVTVVILSAVLPTIFAQKDFQFKETTMHAWRRLRGKKNGVTTTAKTKHKVKIPGA
ncbi:MAG: hypothetical protein E6H06_13420 [Bacteroidetes bacterium]|nr:MAG: hypothetical protein E6H06_13420 [Bacteroidota bacterium]